MRMSQTLVAAIVTASVVVAAEAQAQTPAPPAGQDSQQKVVQGQVESIDPAGTGITLTDGTRLLTPPGRSLRPGALIEGMTVIASYREENGEKVMTELAIEKPPASPPTERLPATPPTEPLAHRGAERGDPGTVTEGGEADLPAVAGRPRRSRWRGAIRAPWLPLRTAKPETRLTTKSR